MAQVRMHSPPARTVKKPSFRWARQRPIVRGHASDHAPPPPPPTPTITSVSPTSTAVGTGQVVYTFTGTGFQGDFTGGVLCFYTAGADAEAQSAPNIVSDTSMTVAMPTGHRDAAGTVTTRFQFGDPEVYSVTGPSITIA